MDWKNPNDVKSPNDIIKSPFRENLPKLITKNLDNNKDRKSQSQFAVESDLKMFDKMEESMKGSNKNIIGMKIVQKTKSSISSTSIEKNKVL